MLQWLRANGCEWDESACYSAAAGGHLAVLQWATANGWRCDAAACLSVTHDAGTREWIKRQPA